MKDIGDVLGGPVPGIGTTTVVLGVLAVSRFTVWRP
jgi:hypothetical protein